jgi:ribonuclease HI
MLEIYTDGSCNANGKPINEGIAVTTIVHNNSLVTYLQKKISNTTNNFTEYLAYLNAIHYLLQIKPKQVTLYTDSMLVVWLHQKSISTTKKYKKRGKTKLKKVSSSKLYHLRAIEQLAKILVPLLIETTQLEVKWVKGHASNKWNNYTDALTNQYSVALECSQEEKVNKILNYTNSLINQ